MSFESFIAGRYLRVRQKQSFITLIAKELANNLRAKKGDIISLISPGLLRSSIIPMAVIRKFEVSGFFKSGYYDFDSSYTYIHLNDAQKILRAGDSVTGIEVRVKDMFATVNIAGTLMMLVIGKTRDIAILKTMGATHKSIRKIFVFNGMIFGLIGTGLGLFLGFLLCTILKNYNITRLTGGVFYLLETIPVKLEMLDIIFNR